MSAYTNQISQFEFNINKRKELEREYERIRDEYRELDKEYVVMLEAQRVLGVISEEHTNKILDYITGTINNALSKMFPNDVRRIYLKKKLHANQHTHINVILETSKGMQRDLKLQAGTGLRQTIAILYMITLVVVVKSRKLIIADELMSGLHPSAKRIVMDILGIFAEAGFQFVLVEYGFDSLGKVYLVEKPDDKATVTHLGSTYNNEVFVFNRPVEEVDLNYHEEIDEDTEAEE